jgi:hypothetical protein
LSFCRQEAREKEVLRSSVERSYARFNVVS